MHCIMTISAPCPENIGIYSLYIIRMEDDTNPEYAYWRVVKIHPGFISGFQAQKIDTNK